MHSELSRPLQPTTHSERSRIFDGDRGLWILYLLFIVISLFTVASALSTEVYKSYSAGGINPVIKHAIMLLLGFGTTILMAQFPAIWYRRMFLVYTLPVLLMVLMLVFLGRATNGADRWINIFGLTLQPSEFIKPYIVLLGAAIVGNNTQENPKRQGAFYVYWGLILILTLPIALHNLSSGIIFIGFLIIYSWVIKAPRKALVRFTIICTLAGGIFLALLLLIPADKLPGRSSTWRSRITGMVEKQNDPYVITDKNRQEQMGRIALASSGIIGKGPGNSKVRDSLAMAYSDYLYAIIIEEYGLLGLIAIPSLYILWMLWAWRLARAEKNVFRSNVLKGLGLLYPMQALVNISVVSGLFTTGQTLPLISFGGSSFVATSMAFGIMIGISRVTREVKALEQEKRILEARMELEASPVTTTNDQEESRHD